MRQKFSDPDWTLKGEQRASVGLDKLVTLWINTGSLCNITCRNCYIESSPSNDRLAYISRSETYAFLEEARALGVREVGFTGGEPFLNPDFSGMLSDALQQGFETLVLTNAMLPMQRPHIKKELIDINERYRSRLTMRVSLDHYSKTLHEIERGANTFDATLGGLDWLSRNSFNVAIAGRTCWNEDDETARRGYATLIGERGWRINALDRRQLVLFPEMDPGYDGPEITTKCWEILNKSPSDMMCASSRMVVKRQGASAPVVLPCTLLPYSPEFEMGATLDAASRANSSMFNRGSVKLCHKNCAKFCVLGGGKCS